MTYLVAYLNVFACVWPSKFLGYTTFRRIGKCEFWGAWTLYVWEYALKERFRRQNICNTSYICKVCPSGDNENATEGCSIGWRLLCNRDVDICRVCRQCEYGCAVANETVVWICADRFHTCGKKSCIEYFVHLYPGHFIFRIKVLLWSFLQKSQYFWRSKVVLVWQVSTLNTFLCRFELICRKISTAFLWFLISFYGPLEYSELLCINLAHFRTNFGSLKKV